MNFWFTADAHLGHENIIRYVKRPFKSLDEMNEAIIKKWNERVKPEDTVFHIGDFCFKNSPGGKQGEGTPMKSGEYESMLSGKIIHVRGNHDNNNSTKTPIYHIKIKMGKEDIKLIHNPSYDNMDTNLVFSGHVHEKWKFKRTKRGNRNIDYVNVGVDVWNFYPVSFNEIMKGYNTWLKGLRRKNEN